MRNLASGLTLSLSLMATCCAAGNPGSGFKIEEKIAPAPETEVTSASGAYLAGNFAASHHANSAALGYFARALQADPGNGIAAAHALAAAVRAGRFDIAIPLARQFEQANDPVPLAELVLLTTALKSGDIVSAKAAALRLPEDGLYVLFAALGRSWSVVTPGHPEAALKQLDLLDIDPQLTGLKILQRALILDVAGDRADAAVAWRAVLKLSASTAPLRVALLAGNFFERNGDPAAAAGIYKTIDPVALARLGYRPTVAPSAPPALVATPADGLAEGMLDVSTLATEASLLDFSLISTRCSLYLRPDFPQAQFALAGSLAAQNDVDGAIAEYRAVSPQSPLSWGSRLAAAELLMRSHRTAQAISALKDLVKDRPDQAEPLSLLGDAEGADGDKAAAILTYDGALAAIGPDGPPQERWRLLFSRGAAREQGGHWKEGEADLRSALALQPDDARVLNYLGFALVIRDEHLDEAAAMLEHAQKQQPDDGAIADSLGWARYHQRRYKEAIHLLERATTLDPSSAEINDHLGDAYWKSGQDADARLQWRRALSLDADPQLARAIRVKLDHPPKR